MVEEEEEYSSNFESDLDLIIDNDMTMPDVVE